MLLLKLLDTYIPAPVELLFRNNDMITRHMLGILGVSLIELAALCSGWKVCKGNRQRTKAN